MAINNGNWRKKVWMWNFVTRGKREEMTKISSSHKKPVSE